MKSPNIKNYEYYLTIDIVMSCCKHMHTFTINPLDTKVRRGTITPTGNENLPEVIAVGSDCTLFEKGDAVYYAGSISRPGTNCEFHLVG